jgi:hypothetical protein
MFEHPELDLLAMTFDAGALPPELVAPIPAAVAELPASLLGSVAVLAGFGVADAGSDLLRFAAEQVADLDTTSISVDGGGVSGACHGDSGGPLLGRAVDGFVRVYGVLSEGSLSCRGEDRYTRLDTDSQWASLVGLTEAAAAESADCGRVSEEGRCFGDVAIWCEAGMLERNACHPPAACGWNEAAHGYRCGDPAQDRCQGVSDDGSCDGSRALTCSAGKLLAVSCDECADTCVIAAATGRVACAFVDE